MEAATMNNIEIEYARLALESTQYWKHVLPTDVVRNINIALSVIETGGWATAAEMQKELGGKNWVIARRTKNIVAKYGKDVKCVTSKQYEAAQRRAIEKRF